MSNVRFHTEAVTETTVLQKVADDLLKIKADDKLTWADMARVMGIKTASQVARYADGTAEMGIVAYALAEEKWNGRFTGSLRRLVHHDQPDSDTDRGRESKILKCALALSEELAKDGDISARDVFTHRATLEAAKDAIVGLLAKLQPRAA